MGIFLHFMVFKANIQLISLFVQYVCGKENCHINVWSGSFGNLVQWTAWTLSKKEKRKDRYNCICVCVLSTEDN